MKKKYKLFLYLTIFIFMGIGYVINIFVKNIYLNIICIGFISLFLSYLIETINKKKEKGNINELKNYLEKDNKENIKTQIEASTEIFCLCETLDKVSEESLSSTENISSFIEIADTNALNQFNMLKETSDISNKVCSTLNDINTNINEKIKFISNSITAVQEGLESMNYIEKRINSSKGLAQNSSQQVGKLKKYSDEIVEFTDMINSISKEINMLSLNASIEAARAGEYGKGFSVVATEVGKLAKSTEEVSSKIEEVIYTLRDEINTIVSSIEEEEKYIEESCTVVENSNESLGNIVENLNIGKDSLEDIKDVSRENNEYIIDIAKNIESITEFSKEISNHMDETNSQILEQNSRASYLSQIIDKLKEDVNKMQQYVAGDIMEDKMYKEAIYIRDKIKNVDNIDDRFINSLLEERGIDAIYITDSNGVVVYTNEEQGLGLNLYEADRSLKSVGEGTNEHVVTPIKRRVEDGKMFKFLAIGDEKGGLYEIGLSLETLMNRM
ncbi:methyl-accepting chemotaxis protein [Sporanaerobacter acetigenes]|uniref:Methyl-accepting chemotaxis protein n=1 Tax=Sporanaerobacter acetigenes DSM 13106 TaxID=1123281 RepID=A0A1M5YSI2_9FIRM|nr:methyl-accepting chemotaxis protein [Sporanaerobacter acetigenes]SHI14965.1 Methyl-accepting chemotaxis protein [Sporanaerobacter acetigenes DSM 13106]